jgi:DNA-binding NtrC family response regulator
MSPRILIVDDDDNTCNAMGTLLKLEGFSADTCSASERALELLERQAYDLLLTDYVMPKMNGVALASAARALRPQIRCCVITGHAPLATEEGARLTWLKKPLDIDALLSVVRG